MVELAWAVESLLNRILEKLIQVTPRIQAMVGEVAAIIPDGVEAFSAKHQETFEIDDLLIKIDALAEPGAVSGVNLELIVEEPDIEPEIELEDLTLEALTIGKSEPSSALDEIGLDDFDIDLAELEPEPVLDEELSVDEEPTVIEEPSVIEEPLVEEKPAPLTKMPPKLQVAEGPGGSKGQDESYDPELDEIFSEEAMENIQVIRAYLEVKGPVNADIVAAYHTLKGSAGMARISTIAKIAAPMESISSQFYHGKANADQGYLDLAETSITMIEKVLGDLTSFRNRLADLDLFLSRAEHVESQTDGAELLPQLDFSMIDVLTGPREIIETWQSEGIVKIVFELEQVLVQSEATQHTPLSELIRELLQVYRRFKDKPESPIIEAVLRAHENLMSIFDQLASSQEVDAKKTNVVSELRDLSVETEEVADSGETAAIETAETSDTVVLPEDNIDDDVLGIFIEEAEELLEAIDESILSWSEDTGSTEQLDNLLRHLHTLKGGARLAGCNSLGEYTHNFETFLTKVRQNPVDFDHQFFGLLNQHQDEIVRRVAIYQKLVAGDATESELQSLRSVPGARPPVVQQDDITADVPDDHEAVSGEAEVTDQIDEEILAIFIDEAYELIESIDQCILEWSSEPNATEHHDNLLRHLHTMKGGSRLAGCNRLGEYTHNFETYLIDIQSNPVPFDDTFFASLNQRQDEITRRVGVYRKLVQGEASEEELSSLTGTQEIKPVAAVAVAQDRSTDVGESKAESGEAKADAAPATQGQTQEMVRVSAELLEELISLSGESNITRGRIEQQITDFGDFIVEMEETISRIRDQVRRLEIETESSETVFRQTQGETDSSFDALEMDRYTMLQEISRTLNEGSSDMLDLKDSLANKSRDAETLLHQQARIGSELQEGLTRTRMVPFARLIPRLRRIVRQISSEVGKSVRFDAFNVEGELDRSVLERIVAPLEHMLRNAVDHGIESTEQRKAAKKPETGSISLRLSRQGGYVVLSISDDGGGIDIDAVRKKAVERGLIKADSKISDHEVRQFIMAAGFSTAQKLTQISGRGVGMDVVNSEIKQLGGSVSIDSTYGVGTEFSIRIPFTVSINRALMVVVREEVYAIPLNTIEGIVRVSPYELEAYYQPDAPMFEYAGQPYRLAYIGKMLGKAEEPDLEGQVAPLPVILARSGDDSIALQVDQVIGSREVVVKTLGPQFNEVSGVAGATVLGDGRVVIILDLMALVGSSSFEFETVDVKEEVVEPANKVAKVMIVDDSVTVRKVTTRLMERHGWEVTTAKDGIDAMQQLQEVFPDVMLLDIEMPKMDGFEVLRSVRRDPRLEKLPIIMITSRTGEKHKKQALELGVNRYLGKPFQEANLISTIEEVIAEALS